MTPILIVPNVYMKVYFLVAKDDPSELFGPYLDCPVQLLRDGFYIEDWEITAEHYSEMTFRKFAV